MNAGSAPLVEAPEGRESKRVAALARANGIVDEVKARSTLVALVQPVAWISLLASEHAQTGQVLGSVGHHIAGGQLGLAGTEFGGLIKHAMRPTGIPMDIYRTGLFMQSAVDAMVGCTELYHGFKNKDTALKLMGVADLVGSTASCAFAFGHFYLALGLNLTCNMSRAALVLSRSKEYSRIQKMKTVFDSAASISAGVMKSGLASVPALAGYVGFGVSQLLYMNVKGIRKRVDRTIDWVAAKCHKPEPQPAG